MKKIIIYLFAGSLILLAFACEKSIVDPVQQQEEESSTLSRRAINQVLVVSAEWDGIKCEVAGKGCLNTYPMRLFNGSLDEAISYVEHEGPESCVSYVRINEEGNTEIELVYATESFEQQIKESPTNFDEFVVGPENVHLDEEIAAALEVETITIPAGTYLIDRLGGPHYWKGIVEIILGPPTGLTNVRGVATCIDGPVVNSYGVSYTVDSFSWNTIYNGPEGGMWVKITDASGNVVINQFDNICLSPSRFNRTIVRGFICNAAGPTPLARNTQYTLELYSSTNASSPINFTTPNTFPCAN